MRVHLIEVVGLAVSVITWIVTMVLFFVKIDLWWIWALLNGIAFIYVMGFIIVHGKGSNGAAKTPAKQEDTDDDDDDWTILALLDDD